MRCMVLASDYDGTLAQHGRVDEATWRAVDRLRESGRHMVLVTGRELDDLLSLCDGIDRFSYVVAENGGVLYHPATRERTLLAPPPPAAFVEAMRQRGVKHLSVSETLVATSRPYDEQAHEAIRELGLDLHVVFNGDAVMILAPGISKATGLDAALDAMAFSPRNAVGVGDAQNDHPLLDACEFGAAVGNALDVLKAHADICLEGVAGAGVAELIDKILADDLAHLSRRDARHNLLIGHRTVSGDGGDEDTAETLEQQGTVALLAGQSGGGKSTLLTGLMERLCAAGYQFCALDPEGDFDNLEKTLAIGNAEHAPKGDDIMKLLRQPRQPVVANLMHVAFAERPSYCAELLAELQSTRALNGRPHWILFDEAHQLFPNAANAADETLPEQLGPAIFATVHPNAISQRVLERVNVFIGAGPGAWEALEEFARAAGIAMPRRLSGAPEVGQALVWRREPLSGDAWGDPRIVRVEPAKTQRRRHVRKYAAGMLIPERSFYFRGPENRLKLRAHNLTLFLELADGVDEDTWLFHLRRGDYSTWFRDVIGDAELADETAAVEREHRDSAEESLAAITRLVQVRYTQPENPVLPNVLAPGAKGGERTPP
ncbi:MULTISPECIES: HAD-IIB family hydrolase [Caballeronia]|uniref:Haloacid dehalogenase n=1 Tax=Caballeronia zhejiangensis TaxID=871203 RepID=A0A656QWS1_9BURK|nr:MULTISPECIES: HAD-IIB family hydrolase [Caballeronia]EKS70995.1 HAD-superfamily hydrolase [Burkholderia sp. SJ98]KDR34022.1 haloacid dehalogenase [Caballeronia zhejiangensis]